MSVILEILLSTIIKTYLLKSYCLVYITSSENQLYFNTNLTILTINENLPDYNSLLLNSLNAGCDSYVLHNINFSDFLNNFDNHILNTTQKKGYRKFIYILNYKQVDDAAVNEILTSDRMKYMPDLLIVYPDLFIPTNLMLNELGVDLRYKLITRWYDNPTPIILDYWYSGNKSFLFESNLFPDKCQNFNGMVFNVSIFTYKPYSIIEGRFSYLLTLEKQTGTNPIEIC